MTPSLAELIASKTWRVVVAREGLSLNGPAFCADVLQQLAAKLDGTPVAKYPDLHHPATDRVREAGGPLDGHTVGHVLDPVFIEGFGVTATIRLTESQDELQRELLLAHFTGRNQVGLSVFAEGRYLEGAIHRRNEWGNLESQGLGRVMTGIDRVYSVDLVHRAALGGRFVVPSVTLGYGYTGHSGRVVAAQ